MTIGTAIRFEFRLDGGPVVGTGERAVYRRDGLTCKFTTRTTLMITGTFDAALRQLTGTITATETTKVSFSTTEACDLAAGTSTFDYSWIALVASDGASLAGSASEIAGQDGQLFVATISPLD